MDPITLLACLLSFAAGVLVAAAPVRARRAADATTAGALERQAVEHLVAPLTSKLTEVDGHLRTLEVARASSYAALREQVEGMRLTSEALRTETAALVTALRAPQTRGRWGEIQLRRVIETAGMLEHCDFTEQTTLRGDDAAVLRPDLVVRLAGGRSVVVDSKVPLTAYLEAAEARDDATRAARRKAHARHLRDHVKALSDKAYWSRLECSPEFVVMFVPADAFLDAALQEDPELLEAAFARDVVIATPSTLMALLRTIAFTWRQDALAANAQEVSRLGRELHDRLATMGTHMDRLGRSLGSAVDAYNRTVGSLESRVLTSARRFRDLGVTDAVLAAPTPVDAAPRAPGADELWPAQTKADVLVLADHIATDLATTDRAAPDRAAPDDAAPDGWAATRGLGGTG